jgi:hypothetical protein
MCHESKQTSDSDRLTPTNARNRTFLFSPPSSNLIISKKTNELHAQDRIKWEIDLTNGMEKRA